MFATWTHFADHMAPIWFALPESERGVFLVDHVDLAEYVASLGIAPVTHDWPKGDRPLFVAAFGDQKHAQKLGRTRIARMEHGIGQSFLDSRSGSYAGGVGADGVGLFLCPNEYSADKWRQFYPRARVEVVGCPKLASLPAREPSDVPPPVAALSFHWPGGNRRTKELMETSGCFYEYRDQLVSLHRRYSLIGHGHPRAQTTLVRYYRRLGIPFVDSFADVCRQADVYVCDTNCVVPETPILCADLRWRPAGALNPGDLVIGCDEERTRQGVLRNGLLVQREDRRFHTSVVEANELKVMPCVTVQTTDGDLTVSAHHPYLVRRTIPHVYEWPRNGWTYNRSHERWDWVKATDLRVGDEVAFVGDPWSDATDRDAGWLAGMLDGEGNLNQQRVSVAQNPGAVLNELMRQLSERAIPFCDQRTGRRCRKLTLGGRFFGRLRVLGQLRPVRLLQEAERQQIWEGVNVSAAVRRATVTGIGDAGDREVAALQTSTRTFVAGGFMAHNSTIYEWASTGRPVVVVNSKDYRRELKHGLRFDWGPVTNVGVQCDRPADIIDAIAEALQDAPERRRAREQALDIVYAYRDGSAAQRAADALLDWASESVRVAA
jgi:hypothetical protein